MKGATGHVAKPTLLFVIKYIFVYVYLYYEQTFIEGFINVNILYLFIYIINVSYNIFIYKYKLETIYT